MSFASLICRPLSPDYSLLEADDGVLCEDSQHFTIQVLSSVVIVLFSFGTPMAFGYILITKARDYGREQQGHRATLARQVAEEFGVETSVAAYVIRDTIIGADYSFLMDA